jgi:hypothetical protein
LISHILDFDQLFNPQNNQPITNQPINEQAKMHIAMTKTTLFAAALAMASTASAHMLMDGPKPFKTTEKSPLLESGSNFPCQIGAGGSYVMNTMNNWTVGSDVTLAIAENTATHSGGSCQVSVTKDKEPTPQSVWKVIHSIEGGCPQAKDGNLMPTHNFTFTVPSEVPNGQLTMAWTWFNKVGNREMYMDCAPVKVSGGSGDGLDSLPDMAVANLESQGSCKTTPNFDYTFANPGKYVTKAGKGPYKELCGGAPSEGGSTGGGAPSSTGGGAPSSTGGYGSNGGSGSPGGFNSGSSSGNSGAAVPPATPIETPMQPNATTPKEPEATTPKEPESSTPKPPSTGNSSSGDSSSGGASGGVASSGGSSCSEEGAITCKDQDHFGICSNGSLVWQSVAAGTACNNGVIARRGYMHRHQRHSI